MAGKLLQVPHYHPDQSSAFTADQCIFLIDLQIFYIPSTILSTFSMTYLWA